MTETNRYETARAIFAGQGIDTDQAQQLLKDIPVSMHCWQGNDVLGFEAGGPLTGGIQTTGNYPGRAPDAGGAFGGYGLRAGAGSGKEKDKRTCELCYF